MKAIVIAEPGPPSVLKIQEETRPDIRAGEVMIKVKAAGLNRADLLQRKGLYPSPPGTRSDIPGLEVAGTVERNDDEGSSFREGDRVMALLSGAGYAEYVAVPAAQVMEIPDGMSFEEAAAIPEAFITAFDALVLQMALGIGETLLIHAVGSGVGTAALQIAKELGARVLGTAGSDSKLEFARGLGLQHGFNYRTCSFAEEIESLEYSKVDAILDLVGERHFKKNLEVLKPKGRLIVVGLVSGHKAELNLRQLMNQRLTISGTVLRSRSPAEKAILCRHFAEKVLPLFRNGRLSPVLDKVFRWEDVVTAHSYMEENRNFGKVVLRVG